MRQLVFDPYIPMSLWVTLAVVATGLLAWYALASRRRLPMGRWLAVVVLMSAAVALPLGLLLNPIWIERIPPPAGKPLLTVLVDDSASMATRDMPNNRTRYATACQMASDLSHQLGGAYSVRVRTFAEHSQQAAAEDLAARTPDGGATELAAALDEALQEDCPQGQAVLLLSDGIHNASGVDRVRQAAAKARAMAAPVMAKTLGGATGVRDLEVHLNLPQELAFVGQKVPVAVRLQQRGALARKDRLSLVRDGRTVEERDAELLPDGTTQAIFNITEDASGLYRYEIQAAPLAGEVTTVNNAATLLLRVIDEPVRVLLLEGKPYWDTKFLLRTLSSDRLIELTSVVRLAEGRFLERKITPSSPRPLAGEGQGVRADAEPRGPTRAAVRSPAANDRDSPSTRQTDQWSIRSEWGRSLAGQDPLSNYQIVILGRDAEVFLTDDVLARLEKWLGEAAGSLVCFRGAPASQIQQRLAALMPVRWKPSQEMRFRVQWTEAGEALHWLPSAEGEAVLPELPSLAAVTQPEGTRPLTVVLATTSAGKPQEQPAFSYQRIGSGRVIVLEGAGMWRWAFLPPQYKEHDEIYGLLWRSLMRWVVSNVGLLPSQRFLLTTEKVTFSTSEPAWAELLIRGTEAPPQVLLSGDGIEKPRPVGPIPSGSQPGQFRVSFGRLPEGRYAARVAGAEPGEVSAQTAFDVRGNLRERLEVQARPDLMRLVAEESGGRLLEAVDSRALAWEFDQHLTRSRPERIERTMGWDRWWTLAAAITVCAAAWTWRRRSGLV